MGESKITPGVIYKAVLLAFGLVIAAMIFRALTSLVLGVLIVVIIATPLSAFATCSSAGASRGRSERCSACCSDWSRSPDWWPSSCPVFTTR